MPLTAIVLHVVRPGGRADELLAGLASRLGRAMHPADERGHVRILLEQPEGPAWERVHEISIKNLLAGLKEVQR